MKPDLLDSGMDSVLAMQALWLSRADSNESYDIVARATRVAERAEQLMPGIGFGECAEAIKGTKLSERIDHLEEEIADLEARLEEAQADYDQATLHSCGCI